MLTILISSIISACIGIAFIIKICRKMTTKKCTCTTSLAGKTVLITGGNSGIGKATAMEIAKRGAKIILASLDESPNLEKSKIVQDEIIENTGNYNVEVRYLDLRSLASVRKFCSDFLSTESRLDVLINNAGCMGNGAALTADGNIVDMQVNQLGPFLLTNLLLDLLKASAPSRIVVVASSGHKFGDKYLNPKNLNDLPVFSPKRCSDFLLYCVTKLCNMLMVNELERQLRGTGVTINAVHPGAVKTAIWTDMPKIIQLIRSVMTWPFLINTYEGAQTSVHVAISEKLQGVSGEYFANCKVAKKSKMAGDVEVARAVWETSWKLVQEKTT